MAWTIEYTRTAREQLRKLDRSIARHLLDYMVVRIALLDPPRQIGNSPKGSLGELWRYRVGDYRLLGVLRDAVVTELVLPVGPRRDGYR